MRRRAVAGEQPKRSAVSGIVCGCPGSAISGSGAAGRSGRGIAPRGGGAEVGAIFDIFDSSGRFSRVIDLPPFVGLPVAVRRSAVVSNFLVTRGKLPTCTSSQRAQNRRELQQRLMQSQRPIRPRRPLIPRNAEITGVGCAAGWLPDHP